MLRSAEFFKDETLQGMSRAIKHLHQMQAEAFSQKMENFGITKNNPHFRSLLNHLDMALSLGLEEPHKGYWPMIKKICHKATVQMVESHEDAANNISRGQIWLFLTFIESSLLGYLKMLKENKKMVKWSYKKYALIRDEERFEILEQLVVGLEMVNFVLDFSSPYLASGREPIFKASEFYGVKTSSGSFTSSASSSPRLPSRNVVIKPDVTITTPTMQIGYGATPDLLCKAAEMQNDARGGDIRRGYSKKGSTKGERKFESDTGDGLVTHLRPRKRENSKRRKQPSRSESITNELEEDNYIPEFQDSLPITVVVPDNPDNLDSSLNQVTSDTSISDETVYTNFLMDYQGSPAVGRIATPRRLDCLSLDHDVKRGLGLKHTSDDKEVRNEDTSPRIISAKPNDVNEETDNLREKHDARDESGTRDETKACSESVKYKTMIKKHEVVGEHDKHDKHDNMTIRVHDKHDSDVFRDGEPDRHDCDGRDRGQHDKEHGDDCKDKVSSSLPSEGAYRITYVSDDEDENEISHETSREKYRSLSLDSFDRFCRSGSVGQDTKRKSYNEDDDGDDDDCDLNQLRISPLTETKEKPDTKTSTHDIHLDSDAIATSPMSEKLSKESVDKILTARFDTTTGILLPTLPRRPDLAEACEMYQGTSLEQNVLVLLSLEIFEKSTETFKKIFDVYIGYLFGLRRRASILITNENMYLLTRQEKQEPGYLKELTLPLDGINRIQTGLNVQDVLVTHDNGTLHLWTGNEVLTKHIILTLSSELKAGDARSVTVDQMKVDSHSSLEFIMNDWLMFLEGKDEPDIFHFGLVEFHSIAVREPSQKVLKSGYLQHKQNYLGMVPYWEPSIFGLRGSSLYEYSGKGANELKHVYDLGKCGGCVRMKSSDKPNALRLLSQDGSTPLLELAAETEEEANDWIVNICQVVADAKHGRDNHPPHPEGVSPRGLLLSSEKLYLFTQEPRSGRLVLMDSCTVQDITQICVDNQDRTYCVVLIDDSIDNYLEAEKRKWILKFHSEYELGKFEQKVFASWHLLYQVPLQFVLLADKDLRATIQRYISVGGKESISPIGDSQSVSTLASL